MHVRAAALIAMAGMGLAWGAVHGAWAARMPVGAEPATVAPGAGAPAVEPPAVGSPAGAAFSRAATPSTPAADDASGTQVYELPAAALHEALQRYSELTGRSVIYEADMAAQRRSAPVRGRMSADDALRGLLSGSGVRIGYATGQVYTLLPDPPAAAARSSAAIDEPARQQYYGRLQARVLRALCADPLLQTGTYRVALRFRIDGRPSIDRLRVAAIGRPELEPRIIAALSGLPVLGPPPGLGQPITMLLSPEAGQAGDGCKP